MSIIDNSLIKTENALTAKIKSFANSGSMDASIKHLYRGCIVFILKSSSKIGTPLESFTSKFKEFKGQYVVLKGNTPSLINLQYLDIANLAPIDPWKPYIMFPVSYSPQNEGASTLSRNQISMFSNFDNKDLRWTQDSGDVVSINVNNSIPQTSTANIELKNVMDKYIWKSEFESGDSVETRRDKLNLRGKCLFETNDVIVICLPTLQGRLAISFTGFINNITISNSPLQNTISLTCEDVTKPLRLSRLCTKKAVGDPDPDSALASFNVFLLPNVDGTGTVVDKNISNIGKSLLESSRQSQVVNATTALQKSVDLADYKSIQNYIQKASEALAGDQAKSNSTLEIILSVLSLAYCHSLDYRSAREKAVAIYKSIDGESLRQDMLKLEITNLEQEIDTLIDLRNSSGNYLRNLVQLTDMRSEIEKDPDYIGFTGAQFSELFTDLDNFIDTFIVNKFNFNNYYLTNILNSTISIDKTLRRMTQDVRNLHKIIKVKNQHKLSLEALMVDVLNTDVGIVRSNILQEVQGSLKQLKGSGFRKYTDGKWSIYKDNSGIGDISPVAIVEDTRQSAFELILAGPPSMQKSDWEGTLSILSKWTKTLNYELFADELGIVQIRAPNIELNDGLLDSNSEVSDSYKLTNDKIIKFDDTQDTTDFATSAYVTGTPYIQLATALAYTPWLGFSEDERTKAEFGYGQRLQLTVPGLLEPKALRQYAQLYIERYNKSRLRTATATIIGDSNIRVGKWVHVPSKNALYYVIGISHRMDASSYKMTLKLIYKRSPLGEEGMSFTDIKTILTQKRFPTIVVNSLTQDTVEDTMTYNGLVWEPVVTVDWEIVRLNNREPTFIEGLLAFKKRMFEFRKVKTRNSPVYLDFSNNSKLSPIFESSTFNTLVDLEIDKDKPNLNLSDINRLKDIATSKVFGNF